MKPEDRPLTFELNLDTIIRIEMFCRDEYWDVYLYSGPESEPALFYSFIDDYLDQFQADLESKLSDFNGGWIKVRSEGFIMYLKNSYFYVRHIGEPIEINKEGVNLKSDDQVIAWRERRENEGRR